MSVATRRQVPWEIAAYSPRVHAQAAMALNSGLSLNEETAAADWDLQTRQDRDDLLDAFHRLANGFTPYLPGGSKHQPQVSEAVFNAREALQRGDLDTALDQLTAAAEQRHATRDDDPVRVTVDEILGEISERIHPDAAKREQAESFRSGRAPGMSAMTAAKRVRETVEEADRSGRSPDLTEGDIEALDRVYPEEADDAAAHTDWQHRRPERAPRQPATDAPVHER